MNEKGRQTKLLAAIAVFAMVICAFAVVVPAENADGAALVPVDAEDVTEYSTTVSSIGSTANYYVAATSTAVDATFDLDGVTTTSVLNIYMQPDATISITTSTSVTATLYIVSGTPTDNTTPAGTVDLEYLKETGTAVKNDNATAVEIAATGFGFSVTESSASILTNNTSMVKYIPAADEAAEYYNATVVGNGMNTFDVYTGGSVAIPATAITGNFEVRNFDASGEVAEPVATDILTFSTGYVDEEKANAFTVGTAISVSNTAGDLKITGGWSSGDVTVTKGSVESTAALNITGTATLKAVSGNWVTEAATTLYSTLGGYLENSAASNRPIVFYGDHTNVSLDLTQGDRIHVAKNGSLSATFTYTYTDETAKTSTVSIIAEAGESDLRYVVQGTAAGLAVGSVISGTAADVTGAPITITKIAGDITVSGVQIADGIQITSKITVGAVTNVNNTAPAVIVPNGASVGFGPGGQIALADSTAMYLFGTLTTGSGVDTAKCIVKEGNTSAANIYGSDSRLAAAFCSVLVTEGTADNNQIKFNMLTDAISVTTYEQLVAALNSSRPIEITATIEIPSNAEVSIIGKTIEFSGSGFENGVGILLERNATLSITDSTLDQADGTDVTITTEQYTQLNITNSLIFMVVDVDDLSDLNVDNHEVTYDYSTDDVKVGFGTTLVLSSIPKGDVFVYGTLNINEGTTVTIEYGKMMTVAPDATVNMNGTLNVEGTVVFYEGSTGKIAGTVNVRNTQTGGAQFISAGDVEVSGTMTVSNKSATAPLQNELIAVSMPGSDMVWSGFTVTGTLNVNGGFSGIILDKGTVNINGQVTGAQYLGMDIAVVVLFDGVSISVGSVSGGNLVVTDYGISNEAVYDSNGNVRDNTYDSSGNIVVLDDVKGVTVSETVTAGNYTDSEDASHAYYVSDMYISGSATRVGTTDSATDENITVSGVCTSVSTSEDTTRCGAVHIAEADTLTLGEDVVMGNYGYSEAVDQKLCVDGTLNVTGEGAKYLSGSKTWNTMSFTAGAIDVNGTVVIGPEAADVTSDYVLPGAVTGVRYAIQTTENNVTSTTIYYAGFDAAVTEIADAVDDTITVYGEVTVGADATIAANQVVLLNAGAVLTVDEGITLTFENGGKVSGTQASIDVKGTMESANYREDVSVGAVGADVVVTNEPARTWTSFYNALENATAPETIELSRDITLTQNTTIPEGITVTTEHDLNTSRYTLTVNGTLDVLQGGDINTAGTPKDGDVVANGVVVMRSLGDSEENVATLAEFDGAHFTLRTGATVSNYVTNLGYAAENVTSGTVTVTGAVSAGEVVFTEAANATSNLVVRVVTNPGQEVNTVLSLTSMELNGATFTVDALSKVSGTVVVPYGDGTADAEIELSRASGYMEIDATSTATATGTEYSAEILGTVTGGSVDIAAGTVEVASEAGTDGFTASAAFGVASGATLVLEDVTLTANLDKNGAPYVTIDGTVEIDNGTLAGEAMALNGTMNVVEDASTGIAIYSAGTIAVGEDATLTVDSKVVVGAAPGSLGVGGQLAGDYQITTGYILAYAGADLTGATINWNDATGESDAETTTYYVNDVEYATVYGSTSTLAQIEDVFGTADGERIELVGLDTAVPANGYVWKDADDNAVTGDIGSEEAVYIEFDPSTVDGIVTVGAGINLYIDGVQVSGAAPGTTVGTNFHLPVGTHKVSYEIKAGWDGSSVVLSYNGQAIQNNSTITVTADMTEFTLSATGAINSTGVSDNTGAAADDGMGLTDYLLIILVVLIVVMAIMVALRLMRS